MKNVGIISMQRVPNYGSFLQAYALKKTIESLGLACRFVDYREGGPLGKYSAFRRALYKCKNLAPVRCAYDLIKSHVLHRSDFACLYRSQYLPLMGVGYRKTHRFKGEYIVVGSDEVFNCTQSYFNVGFSPMLFGQGMGKIKVISYAASFGYTTMNKLQEHHVVDVISSYLQTFCSISVRDQNSFDIVHALCSVSLYKHLDPVLIYDFPLKEVSLPQVPFAILYTYTSRVYSEEEVAEITSFCKKRELLLLSLGEGPNWVDQVIDASPFEVLFYFKNAGFIITDTFHGTVFSIKYNKNFVTRVRADNENKLRDLLIQLHRTDRIITNYADLESMYCKSIDYTETNITLEQERKRSIEYLQTALDN